MDFDTDDEKTVDIPAESMQELVYGRDNDSEGSE